MRLCPRRLRVESAEFGFRVDVGEDATAASARVVLEALLDRISGSRAELPAMGDDDDVFAVEGVEYGVNNWCCMGPTCLAMRSAVAFCPARLLRRLSLPRLELRDRAPAAVRCSELRLRRFIFKLICPGACQTTIMIILSKE